jgi:hypothetical protein
MAYAANKDGSTGDNSCDGTDVAATEGNSARGFDLSRLWPFALIAIFGILFFYFSRDMLSFFFKTNDKKKTRSRNAKAMKLFMKYSD